MDKLVYRSELSDMEVSTVHELAVSEETEESNSTQKLIPNWRNISLCVIYFSCAFYGLYLAFTSAKLLTVLFGLVLHILCGIAVTGGTHRLWSHKAYKVTWQLNMILVIFQTIAYQGSAISWARLHRIHHKYTDTDADPHNARRGFFFSHLGWLLFKKNEKVKEMLRKTDMSDLYADPLLAFQDKHYIPLVLLLGVALPILIPVYFWNETLANAFFVNSFKLFVGWNSIWLINSVAHIWGTKPYDKSIEPTENSVASFFALGEGWHNYHHTFPWDYKASELGSKKLNLTAAFIDLMANIGWAYDLKTVSEDAIKRRILRTGDGSHNVWGWDDKDITKEEQKDAVIINKKHAQ